MQGIFEKHRAIAPALCEHLAVKDAPFRKLPDCLLLVVCGKWFDIILKRRKSLEAAVEVSSKFLKEIPRIRGTFV